MNSIITNNIEAIGALCQKHHVKELYAFGSVVRDDFNDESDVDFLARFSIDANTNDLLQLKFYFNNLDELKAKLEKTLHRQVDLLEEKNIRNIYLVQNINKEKRLLYANAG